jgi:hypothetical protein
MTQTSKRSHSEGGSETLKKETDKVTNKIDESFDKLAKKLRNKADKAKEKLSGTSKEAARAILLRRFELYADAANHLEEFTAPRRRGNETDSD